MFPTKLKLVSVTAMFIVVKYKKMLVLSINQFILMADNMCSKQDILKGEQFVLRVLDFKISNYCSYITGWQKSVRLDDLDDWMRMLSKFLMEATLLDWSFVAFKLSLITAVCIFTARSIYKVRVEWVCLFASLPHVFVLKCSTSLFVTEWHFGDIIWVCRRPAFAWLPASCQDLLRGGEVIVTE